MFKHKDYIFDEVLCENSRTVVFRAKRKGGATSVIIKYLKPECIDPKNIKTLENEYELLKILHSPSIIGAFDMVAENQGYFIVMEDAPTKLFNDFIEEGNSNLEEKLDISIQLAEAVEELHANGIIHTHLSPSSFLVSPKKRITLFDLEFAKSLARVAPEILEGKNDSKYHSPERMGAHQRFIDFRTDIYSLGAILYSLFMGPLHDPVENLFKQRDLGHSLNVLSPSDIDPKIPKVVSDIIMKCLNPSVDHRYKSAYSVVKDLKKALSLMNESGEIPFFNLEENDIYSRFHTPNRIFGREREVSSLDDCMESAWNGTVQAVSISGGSGVGESSLIFACKVKTLEKSGRFALAKSNPFQQHIPYQGLIQVLSELVKQIMPHTPEEIDLWRMRINDALEENARLLTDIIPDLKKVIGELPNLPELTPEESENRFKYNIAQFLKLFTKEESPLVLAFDDFQWGDESTLSFLSYFLQDPYLKYTMVIFAYREDEMSQLHPLHMTLKELTKKKVPVTYLHLSPLGLDPVNDIIIDIFPGLLEWEAKQLATLIDQRTKGNPLYIILLLQHLYNLQLIFFDRENSRWIAKIEEISKVEVPNHLIEFLRQKFERINPKVLDVLKVCAVLGNTFRLDVLENYFEGSTVDLPGLLEQAINEEMIVEVSKISNPKNREIPLYQFLYDPIYQVCYEMLQNGEKAIVHFRVGETLVQTLSKEELNENLIGVVNHLNYGFKTPLSDAQKARLLDLNHRAGIKAKDAQVLRPAIDYFRNAILLLNPDGWKTQYPLTFSLYKNLGSCLQLVGSVEESEKCFNLCLENAKTDLEKGYLYAEMINLLNQSQNFERIFEYAEKGLKLLNYRFDMNPSHLKVVCQVLRMKLKFSYYTPEKIESIPPVEDERIRVVSRLLICLTHPSYAAGQHYLFLQIVFSLLDNLFKYGQMDGSPGALVLYSSFLASDQIQDYKGARRLGTLGESMSYRYKNSLEITSGRFAYIYFIDRWINPLRDSIPFLWLNYRETLASGGVTVASAALLTIYVLKFLTGEKLDILTSEIMIGIQELQKSTALGEQVMLAILRETCLSLMGKTPNTIDCCPPEYGHEILKQRDSDNNHLHHLCYDYYRGFLLYIFGHYEQAKEHLQEVLPLSERFHGLHEWPFIYLAYGLSISATLKDSQENKKSWKELKSVYKRLQVWGENAPFNYGCHAALVKGEIASLEGRSEEASQEYLKAIAFAAEEENMLLSAISYEVIARDYFRKNMNEIAQFLIKKAFDYYSVFGAKGKCKQLQTLYPDCFVQQKGYEVLDEGSSSISSEDLKHTLPPGEHGITSFDLDTIIQASQSLSNEVVLEKLSEYLMRIMVANVGANKAFLVLFDSGQPFVYSEIYKDKAYVPLEKPIPIALRKGAMSIDVVMQVKRTREGLLLDDAASFGDFKNTDYIRANQIKSILCLPLLQKGEIKGILYLENPGQEQAFTPKHSRLLKLLCSQIAISIEKAQFYSKLEAKVDVRTKELYEKNKELQQALKRIDEIQKQMIDQEKLASLGVLTAGISHELKNPLNFVLNFSKIATDNLKDLEKELETGDKEEQKALIKEITDNLGVVATHSERANSIIKGMLAHAHQGSKMPEVIKINNLLDEALGLAYYTYRKKDASINVTFEKHYDAEIPQIKGFPGDLLRVFINIIDNACFALSEKNKMGIEGYVPTLIFTTLTEGDFVIITIQDNGMGMPPEVRDKIFNAFFTTKRVGVGTGLGLSIVLDIINKQHAGEITVESQAGMMTKFTIKLPIKFEKQLEETDGN